MNFEKIFKKISNIDSDLNLSLSIEQLLKVIEASREFSYFKVVIHIIKPSEDSFCFGKKNSQEQTILTDCYSLYFSFKDEVNNDLLLELLQFFITSKIATHIEKSKVDILRTCDKLFDEKLNSAYSGEDSVLDFLTNEFSLIESKLFRSYLELKASLKDKQIDLINEITKSKIRHMVTHIEKTNILIIKLEIPDLATGGFLYFKSDYPFNKTLVDLLTLASEVFDTNVLQQNKASLFASRFKKYVGNTAILDKLIKNPSLLDIKRDNIVVMSVDLVDSTKYASESDNPIEVFENITHYLDFIAKIITIDFNGTLDKYIGDEVMALFGAPLKEDNFIETSIECAKAIITKIEEENRVRKANNQVFFNVRITLGFAENVVIGEVGSKDTQIDYTAIGDGVNRLFRMTSYAKIGEVTVNNLMVQRATNYTFELVDEVKLKGISTPEQVYILKK